VAKYDEWLTEEGLIKIQGWARDGLVDEDIAHNMGITRQTLTEWKKRFPSIFDTLKSGKEVSDRKVENALFKRALGYSFEEITYENGEETKRVVKQVAPDTTAQIFWLKNRKPNVWRDAKDINANVTTDKKLEDFFK
jgi:IS30 family transposase